MDEDPTTEELRTEQARREEAERRHAQEARDADVPGSGSEAEEHERRAAKSAYLKQKLEERAEAERRRNA